MGLEMPAVIDFKSGMPESLPQVTALYHEFIHHVTGPGFRLVGYNDPQKVATQLSELKLIGLVPPATIETIYQRLPNRGNANNPEPAWPEWRKLYPVSQEREPVLARSKQRQPAYPCGDDDIEYVIASVDFYGLYSKNWRRCLDKYVSRDLYPPQWVFDPEQLQSGSGILICPVNVNSIYSDLIESGWPLSPPLRASVSPFPFFLRMTLIHELGHLFWNSLGGSTRPQEAEAMANGLVYQVSDPTERKYLFYKSRLLQSPVYGTYLCLSHRDMWLWASSKQHNRHFRGVGLAIEYLNHFGPFWAGSPCHLFQDKRSFLEVSDPLRPAFVEDYLIAYLYNNYWSADDHNGFRVQSSLRDLDVIHAIYEVLLGHKDANPEITGVLFEAAMRGPIRHSRDCKTGICADPDAVASGRVLAFEFPTTQEGTTIIKRSLEREEQDSYNWIRWDVKRGLDNISGVVIPLARRQSLSADAVISKKAKEILVRLGSPIPTYPDGFEPKGGAEKAIKSLLEKPKKSGTLDDVLRELQELYADFPKEVGEKIEEYRADLANRGLADRLGRITDRPLWLRRRS